MERQAADGGRVDEDILGELFGIMCSDGGEGLVAAYDLFLAGVPARFAQMDAALAEGASTTPPGPPTPSGAAPGPSAPAGSAPSTAWWSSAAGAGTRPAPPAWWRTCAASSPSSETSWPTAGAGSPSAPPEPAGLGGQDHAQVSDLASTASMRPSISLGLKGLTM